MTGVTGDVSKSADSICGTNRNNTIATRNARSGRRRAGKHAKPEVTFTLSIYYVLRRQTRSASRNRRYGG